MNNVHSGEEYEEIRGSRDFRVP